MNYSRTRNSGIDSVQRFDGIAVSIASPEKILSSSYGEVKKPETINYRTFKPEKDGLFCARIFGPVRDYECLCGKYKRIKYRGIVCERCGVEVTVSRVRRERMGHVKLAAPVAHIWYVKLAPSKIALMLDMSSRDLEAVIYCESYVVVDSGISSYSVGELLSDEAYHKAIDEYGEDGFSVSMGAEAIRTMLANLDLNKLAENLRSELASINSELKKKKIIKRLRLVQDFIKSGNKPEWMIMTVMPIMPPEIRPLVMLDGGRFAASDLNELYRRLINRNNRLKRLYELSAPGVIIRNEMRMLQESADALIDNSRRSRVIKNPNKRPYKSLGDILKGKQGRFRQNLLGKRVDYSGRSVIVVGSDLKLHQCGLPKRMALELFKPAIYSRLEMYGIAPTVKVAKIMVENEKPEVWDILEEVIRDRLVLLNRAPTLHRLSLQAFEPILIEGKAIQLHPAVCTPFNADFDGDQMAVHVPLSLEAQMEATVLMMSTNNILGPSNGKPIIVPSKDVVVGIYYLTLLYNNALGEGKIFGTYGELEHALNSGCVDLHARIKMRVSLIDKDNCEYREIRETTPGRVILYRSLPKHPKIGFEMVNRVLKSKDMSSLVDMVYRHCGQKDTVRFIDDLISLGFRYATSSGITFNKEDMVVPLSKKDHIKRAEQEVKKFEMQYQEGLVTANEKYNKVIDVWSVYVDKVAEDMMTGIAAMNTDADHKLPGCRGINALYMMADSGARGSPAQMKQLAGMRGLMSKPSGEIIETPIVSNFREGLTVLEYFNSTHGARKGLSDTALKTANSGYLTRRLVDVAQDFVIMQYDCGTKEGVVVRQVIDGGEITIRVSELILGRVAAEDVKNAAGDLLVSAGEMIDEYIADTIECSGISEVKVRSVLSCNLLRGSCSRCYGRDLATGKPVAVGEAVGIIAAQSIGEPGTQLTMRTFHVGGATSGGMEASGVVASNDGVISFAEANTVIDKEGSCLVMNRSFDIVLSVSAGGVELARYRVPYGAKILVENGQKVNKGFKLSEWDPYTLPILAEKCGVISYKDLDENVTFTETVDENTGAVNRMVTDWRQHSSGSDLHPALNLLDEQGDLIKLSNGLDAHYMAAAGAIVSVSDGQNVLPGDVLMRLPRKTAGARDITGGLPRVAELFEARKPKDYAIISEIDGYVEFGRDYKAKHRLIVRSPDDNTADYLIPKGRHILVNEGEFVSKGDLLIDGSPNPQDILTVLGIDAVAKYIINEIQGVYRLQGVRIDDKHIEVILRQMMQKMEISDPGDSMLLVGEQIDKEQYFEVCKTISDSGGNPPKAFLILQGITKASLNTRSFISAASFQETAKVLTEAAISARVDWLQGLKENILVGRLIPAGTGFYDRFFKNISRTASGEGVKKVAVGFSGSDEDVEVS